MWTAYKVMADQIATDSKVLLRRTSPQWIAQLDRIAVARKALSECGPVLTGRAGIRIEIPPEEITEAGGASDTPAAKQRARLARGLVLSRAGRREEAQALLADAGLYAVQIQRHLAAQAVLDFNRQDFEHRKGAVDADEARVESLMNDYRISLGLLPLEHEEHLCLCARGHSQEMSKLDYFGHDSPVPENRTRVERAKLAGYAEPEIGECIFKGGKDVNGRAVFMGWYTSSPHHRLLLNEDFRQAGAGRCGPYFTANFGRLHALGD